MISRRLRAALVMMTLWGVTAATLAASVALCFWLGRDKSFSRGEFFSWVIRDGALPFLICGLIGGASFSLFLAHRGRTRSFDEIAGRLNIQWWIILGAIAGILGYPAFMAAFSALSYWSLQGSVLFGVICGIVGGGVGSATIAIARRGKAISPSPAHEDLYLP